MRPQDRAKARSLIVDAYCGEERSADAALQDENGWAGLNLFQDVLSAAQQSDVLAGRAVITVSAENMPDADRTYFDKIAAANPPAYSVRGGVATQVEGKGAKFFRWDTDNKVTPSLTIHIGDLGGFSYAGGAPLERAFRRMLQDQYVMDGDTVTVPAGLAERGARSDAKTAAAPPKREAFVERLVRELADAGHINIIARLPKVQAPLYDGRPNALLKVGDHIRRLSLCGAVKWRGDCLTLTAYRWYRDPEPTADDYLTAVQSGALRKAREASGGAFSLHDLVDLSVRLSPRTLIAAAERYPELAHVWRLREFFQVLHSDAGVERDIQSEAGVSLTGKVGSALYSVKGASAISSVQSGTASTVRLVILDREEPPHIRRNFVLRAFDPQGQAVWSYGFFSGGEPPTDDALLERGSR